ncbi:MAG: OB-fold nucleic acid binding domain-containing protein [Patescibacteria group bacterium]|jgi:DNA polymerase-3 subunit alpha|nr:OB-fold nucleic acid binding domain-containing protein [Patescibacteria group bacterium]
MTALLNSDKDDLDRIAIEIEEARGMNIEVLPPSVNESLKDFAVINGDENDKKNFNKIRFGLEAIKGVGKNISEVIIKERKENGLFQDLIEFVERVNDKDLNKKSVEALAMSGALDDVIKNNRNKVVHNVEKLLNYAKEYQKIKASGQSSLFSFGSEDSSIEAPKVTLEEIEPATKSQRLTWEKQLLGLYISDHPLKEYQEYFSAKSTPIRELSKNMINQVITVGGIITKIQKFYTRKNQLMYFVVIEDGIGKIEALIFPKTLEKTTDIWKDENIILLKGKLSDKDDELKLLCEDAILVDQKELRSFRKDPLTTKAAKNLGNGSSNNYNRNINTPSPEIKKELIIYIEKNCEPETIKTISQIISSAETGKSKVFIASNGDNKKMEVSKRIKFTPVILTKFQEIAGKENVTLS